MFWIQYIQRKFGNGLIVMAQLSFWNCELFEMILFSDSLILILIVNFHYVYGKRCLKIPPQNWISFFMN